MASARLAYGTGRGYVVVFIALGNSFLNFNVNLFSEEEPILYVTLSSRCINYVTNYGSGRFHADRSDMEFKFVYPLQCLCSGHKKNFAA
jgi:hypothetical protein